jgi:F-type H+-transporting ATPase subunit epsilon
MAAAFRLQVVTPERSLLNLEVEALVVPATEGYLGILPDHAPLIAGLNAGPVKYRHEGKDKYLVVSGGFIEVLHNQAIILANAAERPEEIDIKRAEAAKERAEKRLHDRQPGTDLVRAEASLKRAVARLKVKEMSS